MNTPRKATGASATPKPRNSAATKTSPRAAATPAKVPPKPRTAAKAPVAPKTVAKAAAARGNKAALAKQPEPAQQPPPAKKPSLAKKPSRMVEPVAVADTQPRPKRSSSTGVRRSAAPMPVAVPLPAKTAKSPTPDVRVMLALGVEKGLFVILGVPADQGPVEAIEPARKLRSVSAKAMSNSGEPTALPRLRVVARESEEGARQACLAYVPWHEAPKGKLALAVRTGHGAQLPVSVDCRPYAAIPAPEMLRLLVRLGNVLMPLFLAVLGESHPLIRQYDAALATIVVGLARAGLRERVVQRLAAVLASAPSNPHALSILGKVLTLGPTPTEMLSATEAQRANTALDLALTRIEALGGEAPESRRPLPE